MSSKIVQWLTIATLLVGLVGVIAELQKMRDEINNRFDNLEMVVTVLSQETPSNTEKVDRTQKMVEELMKRHR